MPNHSDDRHWRWHFRMIKPIFENLSNEIGPLVSPVNTSHMSFLSHLFGKSVSIVDYARAFLLNKKIYLPQLSRLIFYPHFYNLCLKFPCM